jgi:hypothetical protein
MLALDRPSLFHLPLQTHVLSCLHILWRRFRYNNKIESVDWNVLYRLLTSIHIQHDCKPPKGRIAVLQAHREALVKAIARGKRFFVQGSTAAVAELIWKKGKSPHNLFYHIDFAILHLFMYDSTFLHRAVLFKLVFFFRPTNESNFLWIPQLIDSLTKIDASSSVIACTFSVLSRVAKADYEAQTVDLSQYLPLCFHWFLQRLPLSVDGAKAETRVSQKVWPGELDWLVQSNALSR